MQEPAIPGVQLDWSSLLKSPLVLLVPVTVGASLLVWLITEALSFILPKKWLPGIAIAFGPVTGWAVNRLELLDFGWGPDGWGRSVFFGFFAGILAVLGHDWIKTVPPFRWLAQRTPGTPEAPAGG